MKFAHSDLSKNRSQQPLGVPGSPWRQGIPAEPHQRRSMPNLCMFPRRRQVSQSNLSRLATEYLRLLFPLTTALTSNWHLISTRVAMYALSTVITVTWFGAVPSQQPAAVVNVFGRSDVTQPIGVLCRRILLAIAIVALLAVAAGYRTVTSRTQRLKGSSLLFALPSVLRERRTSWRWPHITVATLYAEQN